MTSWEYIKKRRGWTANTVVSGLEDKSWDSFQSFFAQRGIECPEKVEYDLALKSINSVKVQQIQPTRKINMPPSVAKTTKSPSRTHANRSKKKIVKT